MTSQESISNLQRIISNQQFAVTMELTLPDSPDPTQVINTALEIAPYADALNLTDSTSAVPHFSSLAAATLLIQNKIEPVMQISCRDRNRIAIQGDILGSQAIGVRNILCVTGDGVQSGDHPEAKPVFDFDSTSLISTINHMKNTNTFLSGREFSHSLKLFTGGAVNPFAPPFDFRPLRVLKKYQAGASFFQSQFCFDIERLKTFMGQVEDLSNGNVPPILVGVGPIRSARVAKWMSANVPGVYIPSKVIDRIDSYPRKEQSKVGKEICIEIVNELKEMRNIAGIHIMAYRWESAAIEIVQQSSLDKQARQVD